MGEEGGEQKEAVVRMRVSVQEGGEDVTIEEVERLGGGE